MRTRVQRWGNSLAVRIPKSFAAELNLGDDTEVDLALVDGKLAIVPVVPPPYILDDLVAGITEHNLHHELNTGPAVGQEVW